MKKQTKLAVGLSAAALLAIGASMTSFATGWVQEGDEWYYEDSNGDYVEDKWKSYNGNYYYLGDDGAMLTNELVEDGTNYYYVDANGVMVKNTWVAIATDDDDEDLDVDYRWYYFGSSGKAYKQSDSADGLSTKTINGKKYAFDEEGKMLFGFVNDSGEIINDEEDPVIECTYYFGSNDDGAMLTGWLRYEDGFDIDDYEDYEYCWFYFQSSGKKLVDKEKKISGQKYYFDDKGVMLTGWSQTASELASSATATAYKFYSDSLEDGSLKKGTWVWAEAGEDWAWYDKDSDPHWYRTDNQGVLIADQAKKVNSKWYIFGVDGAMQYGLVTLNSASITNNDIDVKVYDGSALHKDAGTTAVYGKLDTDSVTAKKIYTDIEDDEWLYYFSSDEEGDGSMKTGTYTLSLADDDYTFAFKKSSGVACEWEESKKAYMSGIKQTAGDAKYAIVKIGHNLNEYIEVLVNSSGTIQKSTTKYYKDDDDYYYVITSIEEEQSVNNYYGETGTQDCYEIWRCTTKAMANYIIKNGTGENDDSISNVSGVEGSAKKMTSAKVVKAEEG